MKDEEHELKRHQGRASFAMKFALTDSQVQQLSGIVADFNARVQQGFESFASVTSTEDERFNQADKAVSAATTEAAEGIVQLSGGRATEAEVMLFLGRQMDMATIGVRARYYDRYGARLQQMLAQTIGGSPSK